MRRVIIPLLLSVLGANAASAAGPLDAIDSRLVVENFRLDTGFDIEIEAAESEAIPGCRVKTFQVLEDGVPGQIVLALCREGEYGPARIEATIAKQIADARLTFSKFPAPAAATLLEGVDPVAVSLPGGAQGKALALPSVGHGLALVPIGYAVMPRHDASIVVQAYLNPNRPRTLSEPMASLLQGIYKRLQQKE